ncbi:MAG: hypothetical protein ACK53Y_01870, partial [bacterium]
GILLLETTAFFKFDLGKWTSFDIVQDRLVRPIFSTRNSLNETLTLAPSHGDTNRQDSHTYRSWPHKTQEKCILWIF